MCNSVFFVPMRDNSNRIVELADNYCNLGDRVAQVVTGPNSPKGKIRYYKTYVESQSLLSTILKIVSYIVFLGIPWLIACAIKAQHRYNANYQEIPHSRLMPRTEQCPPTTSEDTSPGVLEEDVKHTVEKPAPSKIEGASHPMEKVQEELLAWWSEADEADKYKNRDKETPINPNLVSKLQQLAAQETACPKKEIVLLFQSFRFGFRFFYARMPESTKFLPMPWAVGLLLDTAKERNISLPWLATDPVTKSRVIVNVHKCKTLTPPTGSTPTSSYLIDLMNNAKYHRESEEFRILEALLPYAFSVKEALGDYSYGHLRDLIPAFPVNPVRA